LADLQAVRVRAQTLEDVCFAVFKEYTEKYANLSDEVAKSMAERMFEYDSRLATFKKKVFQEVQYGSSRAYRNQIFSSGSSHRLAGGHEYGV